MNFAFWVYLEKLQEEMVEWVTVFVNSMASGNICANACYLDISTLLEPLERALWEQLLPVFLDIDAEDISNKFRKLMVLAIKQGGLGIRNPMVTAEEFYGTSLDVCRYLVESLVL